jgi:hypothetical protein
LSSHRTDFANPIAVRGRDPDDLFNATLTVPRRPLNLDGRSEPDLRVPAVSDDVHVRWFAAIDRSKTESVAADAQKRWHP